MKGFGHLSEVEKSIVKPRDRVIWHYTPEGREPQSLPCRVLAVRKNQVQVRVLIEFEHGPKNLGAKVKPGYSRFVPREQVEGGEAAVAFHVECMVLGKLPQGRV